MSDQKPSEPQAPAPVQQEPVAPQAPPPQENWKARYDGLVVKVQQLTEQNRAIQTELAGKTSELEQLNVRLGTMDVEKNAAVGERDKRLEELIQAKTALESEVENLRALDLKVRVANELGHPELVQIAQHIPNMQDQEALKTVMSEFANFTAQQVQAREQQLIAGQTPAPQQPAAAPGPATPEAWEKRINELPLGSPERQKAMDDFYNFMEAQNTR